MLINGFPLKECHLAEEENDMNGFYHNILLKNSRDAQGIILYVVPNVIEVNLRIYNLSNDHSVVEECKVNPFISKNSF